VELELKRSSAAKVGPSGGGGIGGTYFTPSNTSQSVWSF